MTIYDKYGIVINRFWSNWRGNYYFQIATPSGYIELTPKEYKDLVTTLNSTLGVY